MERCDRITNLDEDLLSHILSRLPTKEEVTRTSILSKSWRYKWAISYNMNVRDWDNDREVVDWQKFVKFVTRLLFYSWPLRSFRLGCLNYHCHTLSYSQGWISSALKHRLEVLEVNCSDPGIVIPSCLLNSTCLQDVILEMRESVMNVAALNCAPNLTSLNIDGVDIVNEDHITSTTVKFNFPLLETFKLGGHKWLNVKSVELHAPSLTKFHSDPLHNKLVDYAYYFVILTPRLATFICDPYSFIPENFILDGSSIVSAYFGCYPESSDNLEFISGTRIRNLLNEFKNLEELCLSMFLAEGSQLEHLVLDKLRLDKLRRLKVLYQINAEQLLQLLNAAPSLTLLEINVSELVDYDFETLESAPSCIVSHLEEVKITGFGCKIPDYKLLKFLLMNGEKLKKLTMEVYSLEKQNGVKELVSAFRNVDLVFPKPMIYDLSLFKLSYC